MGDELIFWRHKKEAVLFPLNYLHITCLHSNSVETLCIYKKVPLEDN